MALLNSGLLIAHATTIIAKKEDISSVHRDKGLTHVHKMLDITDPPTATTVHRPGATTVSRLVATTVRKEMNTDRLVVATAVRRTVATIARRTVAMAVRRLGATVVRKATSTDRLVVATAVHSRDTDVMTTDRLAVATAVRSRAIASILPATTQMQSTASRNVLSIRRKTTILTSRYVSTSILPTPECAADAKLTSTYRLE